MWVSKHGWNERGRELTAMVALELALKAGAGVVN
jgi:hypothetical protein